jgi:hypothetical protein
VNISAQPGKMKPMHLWCFSVGEERGTGSHFTMTVPGVFEALMKLSEFYYIF